MGAVKISKFFAEAPKISPELLPDTVAQYAANVKTYSGDLLPYNLPTADAVLTKAGTIKTIYPMSDGAGGHKWLHWTEDVDVAKAPIPNDTTQRIYYTGQGEPRMTNYSLATGATGSYPQAFYTLGLPTPLVAPTATAVSFTTLTTASRARDSGNIATIVTASPHGLTTGVFVTITSLGGTGYNLSNAQVTVVNSTTFSYYSSGAAESTTADTAGRVNIAGTTQSRTYVYTWYTAWGEESTPSPVSGTVFVKEGQVVDITGLPATWPVSYTGTYQTTGLKVRVYRTVTSSSGSTYYKVGEVDLGTTTFTDNIDVTTLATPLATKDYDQPSDQLTGIMSIHNQMMVGFFGNTLCFCEPGQPHAWPIKYRVQLDEPIVAVGNFGTSIIVGTTGRPWLIQGNHPSTMSKLRMDYILPCVSKRSMVNMGYGVTYATRGGLAVYSAQTGGTFLTKYVHDWDTWRDMVDADSVVAKFYNGKYFAAHANGAFMFERDDQVGGYLVAINTSFTAGYYSMTDSKFYFVNGSTVYLWDDPAALFGQFDWKSKVIVTKDYMNLGAARVIADYNATGNDIAITQANNQIIADNQAAISDLPFRARGGIGGRPAGRLRVAGAEIGQLIDATTVGAIQFQLYVRKQLVFTAQLTDSEIFRLPAGYMADTFEVRVSGNRRVRAIHIGETPVGLQKA